MLTPPPPPPPLNPPPLTPPKKKLTNLHTDPTCPRNSKCLVNSSLQEYQAVFFSLLTTNQECEKQSLSISDPCSYDEQSKYRCFLFKRTYLLHRSSCEYPTFCTPPFKWVTDIVIFFFKKNARSEVYGTDQHILHTLQGMNVMHLSLSSQHKSNEQKVMCMFYWGLWFSCWVSGLLPILQIALIKYSRNLLVYTSTLSLSYCSGEKGVGIKILDCMWRIKGTGKQTQNNRNFILFLELRSLSRAWNC